ncbi:MAG: KTSC domain-containing protein [Thermomicrobiales bacterium]
MKRQHVDSSMLRSAGYDAKSETLELEFTNGRVYQYAEVPPEVFADLMAADSKGRYVLASIEPFYLAFQISRARSRRRTGAV